MQLQVIAICIRCGAEKRSPEEACAECAFRPDSLSDRAKSLLLSTMRLDPDVRLRSPLELREAAQRIRAGDFRFDPQELAAAERAVADHSGFTVRDLVVDGITYFGPRLLLIAGMMYLMVVLSRR